MIFSFSFVISLLFELRVIIKHKSIRRTDINTDTHLDLCWTPSFRVVDSVRTHWIDRINVRYQTQTYMKTRRYISIRAQTKCSVDEVEAKVWDDEIHYISLSINQLWLLYTFVDYSRSFSSSSAVRLFSDIHQSRKHSCTLASVRVEPYFHLGLIVSIPDT